MNYVLSFLGDADDVVSIAAAIICLLIVLFTQLPERNKRWSDQSAK